jgi:hypothetical protein
MVYSTGDTATTDKRRVQKNLNGDVSEWEKQQNGHAMTR